MHALPPTPRFACEVSHADILGVFVLHTCSFCMRLSNACRSGLQALIKALEVCMALLTLVPHTWKDLSKTMHALCSAGRDGRHCAACMCPMLDLDTCTIQTSRGGYMQVWAAAWRSLEPLALPTHGAAPRGTDASSMQGAGKRGRRGGGAGRRAGERDRAAATGSAAEGTGAHSRGPRLALQGVAARPRAQLLALALVALEQGMAALPPSTLRSPPG